MAYLYKRQGISIQKAGHIYTKGRAYSKNNTNVAKIFYIYIEIILV